MENIEIHYKKVPKTSIDHYISGFEALNVVAEDGTTADWHPLIYWSGEEESYIKLYSNPILGNSGIKKRFINYSQTCEYIANFPRALADLITYHYENCPYMFNGTVEEFLSEDEKAELFDYLMEIWKSIDIKEFLIREYPKEHYNLIYINKK